jgi:hypothetical protein
MSLGMTHSADEEDMVQSSNPRQSVIDKLFQRTHVSFYPAGIGYQTIFITANPARRRAKYHPRPRIQGFVARVTC